MLIDTKVAPTFLKDGGTTLLKQMNLGELAVSEIMPPLSELSIRGQLWSGAISGVTSTVGLATTYTGLILSNTPGSGKLIIPLYIGFAQSVINAAVNAFGVLHGFNATTAVTHTTPVTTLRNNYLQTSGTPAGLLDSAATLPTAPTWATFFNSTPAATTNPNGGEIETKGRFTVPPGGYWGFGAVAASPASALHIAITWAEIPLLP
jgi:hypothetical protein